jgi:hypothetical protein
MDLGVLRRRAGKDNSHGSLEIGHGMPQGRLIFLLDVGKGEQLFTFLTLCLSHCLFRPFAQKFLQPPFFRVKNIVACIYSVCLYYHFNSMCMLI